MVSKKTTRAGYNSNVWFSKDTITNIIALSNLIKQYRVTYDSNYQMFVVHRESQNKPNMEFKRHESGLHYFVPFDKAFVFVNTVSGNKEDFSQRQNKGAESAKTLYAKLEYPSIKDFKVSLTVLWCTKFRAQTRTAKKLLDFFAQKSSK
jgi:hypothetical protein